MDARRAIVRGAVVVFGLAACLAPATAQDSDQRLPSRDFPVVGGDAGNQRYSSLDRVSRTNVARLGGAWLLNLEGDELRGAMQGTPVVVDGVMYIGSGSGSVFAVNASTGALVWKYESAFGGQINRGVVVAEGKVFTGQAGARLAALDQKTGALLWETRVAPRGGTPGVPMYFDGLVYSGISGGEAGARGQIAAYDATTGREVWKFYTIPGPGEFGHDTWEGDSWMRGGGPLWTHGAIDAELGMLYVPVGNPYPVTNGSTRGGNNLFTASILALDLKTGVYKWHFQEVHHDVWDYDNPTPPVLADVQYQGRLRKVLIHGGKTGFTYILDRTDGTPLIGIEERPVPQDPRNKTSPTQPYPIGDSPVPTCPEPGSVAPGAEQACLFGAFFDLPVVMTPGTQGGLNSAPMAFSPQTGLFYVPASIINSQFGPGFSRPAGQPRAGTLTAMDPTTNRIVWQKRTKYPLGTGSGLLATAGGLLFGGVSDGNLVAYDIGNGEQLWAFQTGAGADAPVITYEVNGEQYVAILAGGNSFNLSQPGDNLWAFKLGGTVPPQPAPAEPPTIQPAGGRRGGGAGRGVGAAPVEPQ
ncbi:MAG: PQQ-binding-like beta-propeller repeat protein [Acidobacteria bacterium]|nr:PQQ-binding-like beta-propeller repeat protein [Acidobacteriota bacterium]